MAKSLPLFTSRADFRFPTPNSTALPPQQGRRGQSYVTASAIFHQQVVRGQPAMMQELGSTKLRLLELARWGRYPYRGRRVLFILPPPAIGEHVAIRLFLEVFIAKVRPKQVALLGSDAATDVYAGMKGVTIYPAWMAHDDLRKFKAVIDLNEVPARREIEFWPVDMEAELFGLFGMEMPPETEQAALPHKAEAYRVGILPLASSPMRTLPADLILQLHRQLSGDGMEVRIVLNPQQNQSQILRSVLDQANVEMKFARPTKSVGDLLALMRTFDYAVFADSGPAHLSKLEQRPGAAVFTSAPSDLLLGRHRNLLPIQAKYRGAYCEAPCGLAKVRQTADGRAGCMSSLQVRREDLLTTISGPDEALTRRLLVDAPVPCVAAISNSADEIAGRILADLRQRCP